MRNFSPRTLLGFVTMLATLACTRSPEQVNQRSTGAGANASQIKTTGDTSKIDNRCLYIRQGTPVFPNTPTEEMYASVGLIISDHGGGLQGICSGALIGPDVVLTAHHCVVDDNNVLMAASKFQFQLTGQAMAASVVKIIENDQSPFRDIALLQLGSSMPENIPYYQLKRGRVTLPVNGLLTMVGYGGFTNGADINTYDIGDKRIGEGKFQGYYNDDFFGSMADYLYLTPNNGQIICQGDSGSSLFQPAGATKLITGVTSLGASDIPGDPANPTQAQICHYAADGRYVPSDKIEAWVQGKLESINGEYANLRAKEQVMKGTITKITPLTGMSQVDISTQTYYDQTQPGAITSVNVCTTACPATVVATPLEVGKEIMIWGNLASVGKLEARKIASASGQFQYRTEFNGTVTDVSAPKDIIRRYTQVVNLTNIAQPTTAIPIPMVDTGAKAELCKNCRLSISVQVAALFKDGNRLRITADVVDFQNIYVRDAVILEGSPIPSATPTPVGTNPVDDCNY